MTRGPRDIERRLAELRAAFDESFAAPPVQAPRDEAAFLLVLAGDRPYALRLDDLAGLEAHRTIVPMPGDAPGLLGLCAVRGRLVPAFDLAAILGARGRKETARWLVLVRDPEPIALAFDAFQGSRRVSAQDVHPLASAAGPLALTRQAIQVDGRAIHVVDMAAVVSRMRQATNPR